MNGWLMRLLSFQVPGEYPKSYQACGLLPNHAYTVTSGTTSLQVTTDASGVLVTPPLPAAVLVSMVAK